MTEEIYFFRTAISILVISNRNSFRVLFDEIASVYFTSKKYIDISALKMASPGNRHCAKCIGTLSFPMTSQTAQNACGINQYGLSVRKIILTSSNRTKAAWQHAVCDSMPVG